jgi:hypothetical protein
VVSVGVRDETAADLQEIDPIVIQMLEGICGKIDQQLAVDQRLRSCPERSPADLARAAAPLAVTP